MQLRVRGVDSDFPEKKDSSPRRSIFVLTSQKVLGLKIETVRHTDKYIFCNSLLLRLLVILISGLTNLKSKGSDLIWGGVVVE